MQCDISDFNKCSEFTNEVKDRFGSIDILVNNAGITRGWFVYGDERRRLRRCN